MIIRRERADDASSIREVTAAAFRSAAHSAPPTETGGPPGEVDLIDRLRADGGWIPELSLVAEVRGRLVGHVVGSRATIGESPAIGLGPLSVEPELQRSGIGSALMHAVLGAAEARGEAVVGLLGDPDYYVRFGFAPAASVGVVPPDPSWGDYFQIRAFASDDGHRGRFRYAAPFETV